MEIKTEISDMRLLTLIPIIIFLIFIMCLIVKIGLIQILKRFVNSPIVRFKGDMKFVSHYPNKIIYFNEVINMKTGNKFFIPKDYLILFKQFFPNHPIEGK